MAEGEVLETNRLGGEKRSSWDDCGNWQLGAFTQGCAPSRQAETAAIVSCGGALALGRFRSRTAKSKYRMTYPFARP